MLSIIIPTREEEKAIAVTVPRLKALLTLPHEIIIADGKSKDGTVDAARRTADKVVVFSGMRHTAAIGRNDGARVAQGDLFVFIDADVFIPSPNEFFTRVLAHFETDTHLVGMTCAVCVLPEVETWGDRVSFGIINMLARFQNNVLHRGEAVGKCIIVRRRAFETIGGFREDLVTREDGDFFLRLSRIGRTYFDSKLVVFHGGRRAHALGWPRLWSIWIANTVWFGLFGHAQAEDWTPIR